MNLFKQYRESYTFPTEFWKTFIIDSVTVIILCSLFLGYALLLEQRAAAISAGRSLEQLKLELLAGDEEVNKEFLFNVRWFAAAFFAGSILILLLALILFSYSQQLVWQELLDQEKSWKLHWRWNGMTFMLAVVLLLLSIIYGILRLLLNYFLTFGNEITAVIIVRSFNALIGIITLTFVFMAYYSFARKGKVWEAVGSTFDLIKTHCSGLWKSFVLIIITGIVISVIAFYIDQSLFLRPLWLRAVINGTIFLLFLSWMRLYLGNIIIK